MQFTTKKFIVRLRTASRKTEPVQTLVLKKCNTEFKKLIDIFYKHNYLISLSSESETLDSKEFEIFSQADVVHDITLKFSTAILKECFERTKIIDDSKRDKTNFFKSYDLSLISSFYKTIIISTGRGIQEHEECIEKNIGGRLVIII